MSNSTIAAWILTVGQVPNLQWNVVKRLLNPRFIVNIATSNVLLREEKTDWRNVMISEHCLTTYCPWNNEGIIPSIVVPSIFNSNLSKSCEKTNSAVVRRRGNDVSLTIRQNSWISCWQNSSGLSQLKATNSWISSSSSVRSRVLPEGSRQFLCTDDVVAELEIVENLLKGQWHTV